MSHQVLFIWLASSKEGSTYVLSCQQVNIVNALSFHRPIVLYGKQPRFTNVFKIHTNMTRMILIHT